MYVSFEMNDPYLEGDFDSRIGSDVLLYIFRNDTLTYTKTIPYDSIAEGTEYAILKTPQILGDITLVAWAVPETRNVAIHETGDHPEYVLGSSFDEQFLKHTQTDSRGPGVYYTPQPHERYLGTMKVTEYEGRTSNHRIEMLPAPGRIIVNLTDPGNLLSSTPGESYVVVDGVLSQMGLDKKGSGDPILVRSDLFEDPASRAAADRFHTTDVFGVLPSEPGKSVSVQIMNGTQILQTLRVYSDDNLHQIIESGELLEFDYEVGSSEFSISVNGFTQKIIVEEM